MVKTTEAPQLSLPRHVVSHSPLHAIDSSHSTSPFLISFVPLLVINQFLTLKSSPMPGFNETEGSTDGGNDH
jgi:hypothetical protein